MDGFTDRDRWLPALRWTARIWSIATILLVAGFIVGEGVDVAGVGAGLGFVLPARSRAVLAG